MNNLQNILLLSFVALGCVATVQAQDTCESAVAGMRKVEPKERDPSFTHAAPMVQKLVDEALATHREVILMAIHGGAPQV